MISTPIDFLGVNYYRREIVAATPDGGRQMVHQPDSMYTEMGWEVSPHGLHDLLVRVHEEYAPAAIHVTENGAAFGDTLRHDGVVDDPERQAFLAGHVDAIERAIADGVPVAGYFVWSLLDNFEWAHGYGKRFGIVYVDYPTAAADPEVELLLVPRPDRPRHHARRVTTAAARRVWRNVARRRGAMLVPRQGRREPAGW